MKKVHYDINRVAAEISALLSALLLKLLAKSVLMSL